MRGLGVGWGFECGLMNGSQPQGITWDSYAHLIHHEDNKRETVQLGYTASRLSRDLSEIEIG